MNCPRCGHVLSTKIQLEMTITVSDGEEKVTKLEPQRDTLECHDCGLVLTAAHMPDDEGEVDDAS